MVFAHSVIISTGFIHTTKIGNPGDEASCCIENNESAPPMTVSLAGTYFEYVHSICKLCLFVSIQPSLNLKNFITSDRFQERSVAELHVDSNSQFNIWRKIQSIYPFQAVHVAEA